MIEGDGKIEYSNGDKYSGEWKKGFTLDLEHLNQQTRKLSILENGLLENIMVMGSILQN
jgi:hypothetical protein